MPRTVVQELRIVQIVTLRQSQGKRKKAKGKNRDCDHASYHLESSFFFVPFTFLLFLVLRHCRTMTRRRLLLSDVRGVAIAAVASLVELRQLGLNRSNVRIGLVFLV